MIVVPVELLEVYFVIGKSGAFDVEHLFAPTVARSVFVVAFERGGRNEELTLTVIVGIFRFIERSAVIHTGDGNARSLRADGVDPHAETVVLASFDLEIGALHARGCGSIEAVLFLIVRGAYRKHLAGGAVGRVGNIAFAYACVFVSAVIQPGIDVRVAVRLRSGRPFTASVLEIAYNVFRIIFIRFVEDIAIGVN